MEDRCRRRHSVMAMPVSRRKNLPSKFGFVNYTKGADAIQVDASALLADYYGAHAGGFFDIIRGQRKSGKDVAVDIG